MIINFDKAATSSIHKDVLEYSLPYLTNLYYNPSSNYNEAHVCNEAIEHARSITAKYIGANSDNIVFTSSSSASNTLGIKGYLEKNDGYDIILSRIEHIDIIDCVNSISESVWYRGNVNYCPVHNNGLVDLNALTELCLESINNKKKPFVIIQYVNNELGVIEDIKAISQIVHQHNGTILCDATQAITKLDIDVSDLDVDLLSFGGHKINAFRGVGVLYKKEGISLEPLVYGHQGLQAGTENTAAIVSLGRALMLKHDTDYVSKLKEYFENQVTTTIDCYVNCSDAPRVSSISNVCFKTCEADTLQSLLNNDSIYCSTGSACNSKWLEPSHVLKAINLEAPDLYCCLRFSFDEQNTFKEIDYVINKLKGHVEMLSSFWHK